MKKLKKIILIILSLLILVSPIDCFAVNVYSGNITSFNTPTSSDQAELLWCKQFGTSYKNAPSTMTVVDDTIIVMSKNALYKLDAESGEVIKQTEMAENINFGYTPPTCADGVIYCPLNNGTIQAFSFRSLRSLWIYKDELGGQALSPIMYSDKHIYTGFWNDEDKYANFVCIDVKDENKFNQTESKSADWTYKSLGGFYWAGCNFSGDYVIVGTDDGTVYYDKKARLLSLNKKTGKLNDSISIIGDQRSGITMNGNTTYFVTKAGYLYKVNIVEGKFDAKSLKSLNLGGSSTSTPVIYNNRVYVGVQGKTVQEGFIKIINADTLSKIYQVKTKGYPQNSMLISDAYLKETGKVYIYSTYNNPPGGISVFPDSEKQTSAISSDLFIPEKDKANYCVSNIVCDENGTLFYKNDSGYIFAVANKNRPKKSWFKQVIDKIKKFFKKIFG